MPQRSYKDNVWLVMSQPETPTEYSVEGVFSSEELAKNWVNTWPNKGLWPDGSPCHVIDRWVVDFYASKKL